jgi:hypothetical protein
MALHCLAAAQQVGFQFLHNCCHRPVAQAPHFREFLSHRIEEIKSSAMPRSATSGNAALTKLPLQHCASPSFTILPSVRCSTLTVPFSPPAQHQQYPLHVMELPHDVLWRLGGRDCAQNLFWNHGYLQAVQAALGFGCGLSAEGQVA